MSVMLNGKQDYQRLLMELLASLEEKFSDGYARIRLSGGGACYARDIIEMEAFARPLWGLVPYWAGGGSEDGFREKYQKGIVNGTNPLHPEYWGMCGDCDQRFVEMAPIALGLLMVPDILWTPLSDREKGNLASWLYQINDHILPKCNWYFFRILVNLALRERDCLFSQEQMDSDLAYIDSCYLGEGWYVDGESHQKDYYSAFAMQFYGLLYGAFAKDGEPERCLEFQKRGVAFAEDFRYWFSDKGEALPFGRSLLYRFAQAAFWPAVVYSEAIPEELGVAKGIINRNLEYWFSQEIFQGDKTLSIGYTYPNLTMAERYNAPGSPYWCCKTFLLLALPDEHPFWKAEALPLPLLQPVRGISKADMLIQHRGSEVTAYVPAFYSKNPLGHYQEKYAKFAYSTTFGFSVAHSQELLSESAPDSMLVFMPEGEERVYGRKRSIRYEVEADRVISLWSPMDGIMVETEIRPIDQGHIRRHTITITGDRNCRVYDCGFAVSCGGADDLLQTEKDFIYVGNGLHGCRMEAVSEGLVPYLIEADPNTSLLYKNTRIPALCYRPELGVTVMETRVITKIGEREIQR